MRRIIPVHVSEGSNKKKIKDMVLTYLFNKHFNYVRNGAQVLQFYLKVIIVICVTVLVCTLFNMYMLSGLQETSHKLMHQNVPMYKRGMIGSIR